MTVGRMNVSWEGLFHAVLRELRAWSPGAAANEADCQIRLAELLRTIAPTARVEREYLHMGCKIDAYIKHAGLLGGYDEVLIEAKFNLNSENEFKRLVGQIEMMDPRRNDIIVVLFGKTKPEYAARLLEKYKNEDALTRPWMAIIEKPCRSYEAEKD